VRSPAPSNLANSDARRTGAWSIVIGARPRATPTNPRATPQSGRTRRPGAWHAAAFDRTAPGPVVGPASMQRRARATKPHRPGASVTPPRVATNKGGRSPSKTQDASTGLHDYSVNLSGRMRVSSPRCAGTRPMSRRDTRGTTIVAGSADAAARGAPAVGRRHVVRRRMSGCATGSSVTCGWRLVRRRQCRRPR
jgi:hypothetical protein